MDVGFVGAGSIAEKHLENLAAVERAEVVAVCDVDADTAERVAAERGAAAFTDHEEMYEETNLDAVFVTTPPFVSAEPERDAAERGIDLFIEKPVALTRSEARETLARVESAGVVAQVGYVLRYAEQIELLRESIELEDLSLVEGRYVYPDVPRNGWWRERAKSGGQVVEQSTHVYDLVRYVAGDVESVGGVGAGRHVPELDFPDTTVGTIRHESGTISHVSSTVAATEREISLRLVGPDVAVDVNLLEGTLSGLLHGERVAIESERDPFLCEVEAFLNAVEAPDPDPVRASYAEAVKTLELTLSVAEAANG